MALVVVTGHPLGADGLFQWHSAAEGELQAVVNGAMLAGVLAADRAIWITGGDPVAESVAAVRAHLDVQPRLGPTRDFRFTGFDPAV